MHIYDFLQEWLDNNFRKDERLNFYIFLSENILSPEALRSVCITVFSMRDVYKYLVII
jgi:hypothetical protein